MKKCLKQIDKYNENDRAYNELLNIDNYDTTYGQIHFTQNYIINVNAAIILRYQDIIWVYQRIQRYYSVPISEFIIAHTPFGQRNLITSSPGKKHKEIPMKIMEEIQNRVPDALIGFSMENQQLAKQRIKELKQYQKMEV